MLHVNNSDIVHAWKFDPEPLRNYFDALVIEDELPFAFGGKCGFKIFMCVPFHVSQFHLGKCALGSH